MAYSSALVTTGPKVLFEAEWTAGVYVAILVSNSQTHTAGISTYANISANHVAGATQVIANKVVTTSGASNYLDGDDIDFGSTYSARYMYILKRAGGALASTDKVVSVVDLNAGGSANVSVEAPIQLGQGLLNFSIA